MPLGVLLAIGPDSKMSVDRPCFDAVPVRTGRDGFVRSSSARRTSRSRTRVHQSSNGTSPRRHPRSQRAASPSIGNTNWPVARELEPLVAQARAMHRVLRVVAVLGDELLTTSAATTTVTLAAYTKEALSLCLHVAAIARDNVTTHKGASQGAQLATLVRLWSTGAHSDIMIDGFPDAEAARTVAASTRFDPCHPVRSGTLPAGSAASLFGSPLR